MNIMASTSETGHVKNVANFENLITTVKSYGESYKPIKTVLTIPENEDPENEYITNIVNNIRNKYIIDVDNLDLPLILKDNLKQQIYFNNGVMGIIINSTDEIYNLALQEANGENIQTRGWFKKLWRKIGGALGCTLLTAASISQPVTILSGLGYALSGACWISWLTSTGL